MSESSSKPPLEVLVIHRGIQALTIVTFAAFVVWALVHLIKMFL